MRKKLAVILAATLALQSFTVPAFAGEQYDEVVEVIEDAEGLEAAEDISDDEDIDINYGDDTAETFDETAVDVASAEGEEDDAEYLDIVEEGVEEEADVAAGTDGAKTGEFTNVEFTALREDGEWVISATYTFDGITYDLAPGSPEEATHKVLAKTNDGTGRLEIMSGAGEGWHYPDITKFDFGTNAAAQTLYTSVDLQLNGTVNGTKQYARFKGVQLINDMATPSTPGDPAPYTPHGYNNGKNVVVKRQVARETCSAPQQIGTFTYTLVNESAFTGNSTDTADKINAARDTVALPTNSDVVSVAFDPADNVDGFPATGDHSYNTTVKNYTSDNYTTRAKAGTPSIAVNTKEVNGKVVLVRNDVAGIYYETTHKVCAKCGDVADPWIEVLVLPSVIMSADPYIVIKQDAATPTSAPNIQGVVKKDDLKTYAENGTQAFSKLLLDTTEWAKYDVVLTDCSKAGYYYVVTPKKDLAWDSDVTDGTKTALLTGAGVFAPGIKIVQDGTTLNYTTFADWNSDTEQKVNVDAHHITKTYIEAAKAEDDKYLVRNEDGSVTNLNCGKAIDYTEVTYCVYDKDGDLPTAVKGSTAVEHNYSADVDTTANLRFFKEVTRSKKQTAAKGTTHYPDTVFEKALKAKTSVIIPIQDTQYKLLNYSLRYVDGNDVYVYTFAVPDPKTGLTTVTRVKNNDNVNVQKFECVMSNNTSTCEKDGTVDITLKCTVCGEDAETLTVNIQKHHEKSPEKYTLEVITPATCTKEGLDAQVKKCEICERELERKEVPSEKIPHDFKDQDILLTVNTGNVVIWNGVETGEKRDLNTLGYFGYFISPGPAKEYEIEVELYKLCKSCGEAKQYWGVDNVDVNRNVISKGFEEKTMKGSFVIDKVEPQDELGNNGTITYTVTYTYQDAKGETVTLTKTETKPYYTDFTSYLDRYANNDAKALIANLEEIPDVDKLTLDDAKDVEDAVAAYKALAPNQRKLVDEATDGKVAKAQAKIEELIAEQKETVKKNLDAAVKAAESATAGSEAQKEALENLDKAIATAKVAGIDTAAAEKTLKDQQAVYDKAAAAIAAAEKAAAAAQANPTAENIKAAEDAIAAAKAAGVADADLKKATDAEKAAEKAKKDADDKKIADAVKAAEAAANAAKANPTAATVKAAEDAIAAAKKAGATDAQLANAKAGTDAAKKAAEPKDATFTVSKTTVKKGKKTTIKITSDAGTKITVAAANKKAKNKKSVKVKSGTTAKLTFKKAAKKGTYKFKVSTAAVGNFKATSKTIKIKVK